MGIRKINIHFELEKIAVRQQMQKGQNEFSRLTQMKMNSISAVVFLLLNFVSGFVLPKLIITYYGSATNGLVNSINQFLQVFSFLEMGMGAVLVSSLYFPIAKDNDLQRNRVVSSGALFYRKIGIALLGYVALLIIVYPRIINKTENNTYVVVLILAISAGLFGQYYFGLVDRCVLTAYQKEYIYNIVQSVLIVVTTIVSASMIIIGQTIEVIKVTTGIIMLASPVFIRLYINKNYKINRREQYSEEPIKQKWNGVAQHVSYVVCQSTDTVVLTLFSSLENVSVYAVYNLVANGLSSFINAMLSGAKAFMGDLHAKDEDERLRCFFSKFEWGTHNVCLLMFSCASCLIVDFVNIYTSNISDADYIQPLFGLIFMLSTAVSCLRVPYNMLVQAFGHYKQTQESYIISAVINVLVSIILVMGIGLVGVAVGTLAAMLYQTLYLANYCYKKLFKTSFKSMYKLLCCDVICFIVIYGIQHIINIEVLDYIGWLLKGGFYFFIASSIIIAWNMAFYPSYIKYLIRRLWRHTRQ